MAEPRFILTRLPTGEKRELHGSVQVGREVPEDQIKLLNDGASRHHASLSVNDGSVYLQDEKSRNGSFVNGRAVTEKVALKTGDRLRFYKEEFDFFVESADQTMPGEPLAPDPFTVVSPEEERQRFARLQAARARPSPSDIRQPCLVVLMSGREPRTIPLMEEGAPTQEWQIGRSADCAIRLEVSDVSDRHATLVREDQRWKLLNRIATNGTFVNGSSINIRYLNSGDCLQMGSVDCLFYVPGKNKAARRPSKPVSRTVKITAIGLTVSFLMTLIAVYVVSRYGLF